MLEFWKVGSRGGGAQTSPWPAGGGSEPAAGRPGGSLGTPPGCRPSKTQEFRGFILPRFLFTLSAKLDYLPRVWNFEVNFKNLAFASLSAPGGLTRG